MGMTTSGRAVYTAPKGQGVDCRVTCETLRQKNRRYDPALTLQGNGIYAVSLFCVKFLLRIAEMCVHNIVICTNNPDVAAKYPEISRYIEGSVMDVFMAVRDAVHMGAQVVSHPLSGSIKPWESPYKSVVISTSIDPLDFRSLQIVEDAIAVLKRLPGKQQNYNESVLNDFRIIDLDLIDSALD